MYLPQSPVSAHLRLQPLPKLLLLPEDVGTTFRWEMSSPPALPLTPMAPGRQICGGQGWVQAPRRHLHMCNVGLLRQREFDLYATSFIRDGGGKLLL